MRKKFIIGNWKMHMTSVETASFTHALLPKLNKSAIFVGIAPPFTSIDIAVQCAQGTPLNIGAQNMSEYPKGAYTGEISSKMLKEIGITFVIVGHSERRFHFHEDNQVVQRKLKRVVAQNLLPILCIGETQEERDQNMTEKVLIHQLSEAFKDFSTKMFEQVIIAYEPVWAIGTGNTATPLIAEKTHRLIRSFIQKNWGEKIAMNIPILYGGSVHPDNANALLAQKNIDGALVGGASLEVEPFVKIIEIGKKFV